MHDLTTGPEVGNTIADLLRRIAENPESGLFCAGDTCIVACNRFEVVSQADLRALALHMRLDGTPVVNTVHIVSCLSSKEKTTAWVQQALASLPMLNGLLFCLSMVHDGVEDIALPDRPQPTIFLRPLYLGKIDTHGNRLADYVLADLYEKQDARVLALLLIDPDDTAWCNGSSMTGAYITALMQDVIGRVQRVRRNDELAERTQLIRTNRMRSQAQHGQRMSDEQMRSFAFARETAELEERDAADEARMEEARRFSTANTPSLPRLKGGLLTDEETNTVLSEEVATTKRTEEALLKTSQGQLDYLLGGLLSEKSMRSPDRRRRENAEKGLRDVLALEEAKKDELEQVRAARERIEANAAKKAELRKPGNK